MANLTNTFIGLIEKGIVAMNDIKEPKDKAMVAAELAKAVASTGLVFLDGSEDSQAITSKAPAEKAEEAREAIVQDVPGKTAKPVAKVAKPVKAVAKPVAEEAVEEVIEEEVAEVTPEEEVNAAIEKEIEWTDEAAVLFANELDFINEITESYGEETMDEIVAQFSEGNYSSLADITPLNIKGFVSFLEMLLQDAEEAAE